MKSFIIKIFSLGLADVNVRINWRKNVNYVDAQDHAAQRQNDSITYKHFSIAA